ncbi:MAG TPA: hypothetical protein VH165_34080 [Kofleriaceae bacterium]|jgi:hypothetical protein|nr:hypothetical protein [Kofleriaceae bacterium]
MTRQSTPGSQRAPAGFGSACAALAVAAITLAGCSTTTPEPSPALDMPAIDGDWLDITGVPDLGALNAPSQQPVDFAIWQAADGSWHIWECIRFTLVGGRTRLFYRWRADAPTGPWQAEGIAMTADPTVGETEGGLQAPFVVRADGGYRMFYGSWDSICTQASSDGIDFHRVLDATGQCAVFSEGAGTNTRDPMVLRIGDDWYAYDTGAVADPDGVHGRVYARISRDLETWSAPSVVSYGGIADSEGTSTECPFVVARPDGYYLFRTRYYGATPETDVYRSQDPLSFGIDDDRDWLGTLPVAAPEFFEYGGRPYIAALKLGTDGIRIAPLRWPGT